VFVGFITYIITRETIYYINLREAYFSSPRVSSRLSPRIVLFTALPGKYLDESVLKASLPFAKRIWYVCNCKRLEELVEEQEKCAKALESAEVKLSKIAVKKHVKGEMHISADPEVTTSATDSWVLKKERPTVKTIPIIGKKLDAVDYYRKKLAELIPNIEAEQKRCQTTKGIRVSAAFVEFETQSAAQAAYIKPFWKQPGNIQASAIGIPGKEDVVWPNLGIGKLEKVIRTILANAIIVLLILFWSIPVGLATALADIDKLSESVKFLGFIKKLPKPILGLISGLLPSTLVSTLLSLVPSICRGK